MSSEASNLACAVFYSLVSNDKLHVSSLSLTEILDMDHEYSFVGIQCLVPSRANSSI